MKTLTEQQIFNRVTKHLLKQNKRSSRKLPAVTTSRHLVCQYRGPNGTMCAVGCLIPDRLYTENLDASGMDVTFTEVKRVLVKAGVMGNIDSTLRVDFLRSLQLIHDDGKPYKWPKKLRDFAKKHGLKTHGLGLEIKK